MNLRNDVIRLAGILMLLLGTGTAPAEPPRVPVTMDPNDPEKRRAIISREEREELDLAPHTWTGVVDPQVYATLEKLNETIKGLKETRSGDAAMTLFLMQFPGTVYVEVEVADEPTDTEGAGGNVAAIRHAQRRVLQSLTAAEFRVAQLFERSPGFVGYATKEALDKLATHPDVDGVSLDEQGLPKRAKVISNEDLPPAKPGEAPDELGVAEGKVDPDVYRAFALTDHVYVSLDLRGGDSLPPLTDVPSEMWARGRVREEAARALQDRFLAGFNADEFWPWTVPLGELFISGFVNKEGLEKLREHRDVLGIRLPHVYRLGPELSPVQR
ncbi:MAG TPA: hypothetical protein VM243_21235 [Phycisphaerae bacterium]|nr:hypothetical protein [Phycisphaerae bacterium]